MASLQSPVSFQEDVQTSVIATDVALGWGSLEQLMLLSSVCRATSP